MRWFDKVEWYCVHNHYDKKIEKDLPYSNVGTKGLYHEYV